MTTTSVSTHSSGTVLRRVHVEDVSDTAPERPHWQARMDAWDRELDGDETQAGPEVHDGELVLRNDASRWMYSSPGLLEWRRDLVPSARALYPLQRPHLAELPSGRPVDERARNFFLCSTDSVGVRSRAAVMREIVEKCQRSQPPTGERPIWVSLACGAAVPVLDAAVVVPDAPYLHLVDLDVDALEFAGELAGDQGLREGDDYTVHRRDLVRSIVARDDLVVEMGEGRAAVVDALGIFEYFRSAACVRLLRNAYRLLAPGGVMVVANMLADRPQLAWNRRGAGWPVLQNRSVDGLISLVEQAGLPLSATTVHLPEDGVYAVVEISRPRDEGVIDLRGR